MATLEEQIQALSQQLDSTQAPTLPQLPRQSADDGGSSGWSGLLGNVGEVLSGGQSPTYRLRGSERAAAGSRALLNFGINMLMASGPQRVRPDLGSVFGAGLQGAQQSMDLDQRRAQAVAQQDYTQRFELAKLGVEQNRDRVERLKALIPLLQLQQRSQPLPGDTSATGTTPAGGGTAAAPTGTPFIAKNLPEGVTPQEDQIVRTVWGEANGQPLAGQQAVAHVIKTRSRLSGQSTQDVIFAPNQFEPWNTARRSQLEGLDPSSPEYQRILTQVVRPVMRGAAPDPTGGATHFLNPDLVKSRGDQIPEWASGNRTTIGQHDFYYGGYGLRGGATTATGGTATPPPYQVATTGATPPPPPQTSGQPPSAQAPAAPAAITSAPATAQQSTEPPAGSFEAFLKDHSPHLIPDDAERARWSTKLTPEQEANIVSERKQAEAALRDQYALQRQGDPKANVQEARLKLADLQDKENTLRENARKQGEDAQGKFLADRRKELFDIFSAQQLAQTNETGKQADQARALELENQRRQTEILKTKESSKLEVARKVLEPISAKAENAQAMLKDAQTLELFAKAQGPANALWATDIGKRLNNWVASYGGQGSPLVKEAAARQSWDALIGGLFNDVHVPGMGSQSDREGAWLMSQWGSAAQSSLDRMTQLAIIKKTAEARIADHTDALRLHETDKPISDINDIRAKRQVFDRPPSMQPPTSAEDQQRVARYNAQHRMGEPYVTWAPTPSGGYRLIWARNTGSSDPKVGPMELLDADVSP